MWGNGVEGGKLITIRSLLLIFYCANQTECVLLSIFPSYLCVVFCYKIKIVPWSLISYMLI